MNPQLMHIGIKVDDIEKVSEFYEKVFGFQQTGTNRIGDTNTHTSRHLTDGTFDLALMQYDSEDAPEARLAGEGPCIHHLGIRVDDPQAYIPKLLAAGCEILSPPGTKTVKFRAPGGIIAEVSRFNQSHNPKSKPES